MKTRIIAKRFDVTDDVPQWIEKKLKKLDKFFPEGTEATVVLIKTRIDERIEITIPSGGSIFRAEASDKDYKCALDSALAHLERQIRKNRTRLEKRLRVSKDVFETPGVYEVEDDNEVVKVKKFEMHPMTADEAILQMNLLQHTFYMFLNSDSGRYNVVYQRADGNYGVIEPAE